MDARRPHVHEHVVEVLVDARDSQSMKDVIKAVLHTIFFHRYFVPITPITRDILELTFPVVNDVDLETLVDQRATALVRAIEEPGAEASYGSRKARVQLYVQFFEKKRRKTYFFGKADESVCWEQWMLDVVVANPRTQSESDKVRSAMERSLQRAILHILRTASSDKEHIPTITTTETNPFPYQILVNPKSTDGWTQRMGIFAQ